MSDQANMDVDSGRVRQDFSPTTFVVLILWPVVVALLAIYFVAPRVLHLDTLRADVGARPPIAVIDVDGAIANTLADKPSNEKLVEAQQKVQDAARKLREAGYIVLDSKNVFAYPADFEAKP